MAQWSVIQRLLVQALLLSIDLTCMYCALRQLRHSTQSLSPRRKFSNRVKIEKFSMKYKENIIKKLIYLSK